jgi:hypothetical protein
VISTYCIVGFSGEEVRRTSFDLVPQYHNATKLSGYVALWSAFFPDFFFSICSCRADGIYIYLSIQAVRQTVRIVTIDHPQNLLRTGDRATVIFEFIAHPEFVKAGMKLLFREGKTKVEIAKRFFWELYHEIDKFNVGSWHYHESSIKTAPSPLVSKWRISSVSQTVLIFFFRLYYRMYFNLVI